MQEPSNCMHVPYIWVVVDLHQLKAPVFLTLIHASLYGTWQQLSMV